MSSVSAETKQLSLLGPTFHIWKSNHRDTCEAFFLIFGIFSMQHMYISLLWFPFG